MGMNGLAVEALLGHCYFHDNTRKEQVRLALDAPPDSAIVPGDWFLALVEISVQKYNRDPKDNSVCVRAGHSRRAAEDNAALVFLSLPASRQSELLGE
jgi:hypothetical protein